jgi:serine/threonine protein kinase
MDIPGYKVKRTIGKGGMGTVYLATQESLQRDVVLKTLNPQDAESTEFKERFLNEGRIIASLRHPHIITIFDIQATDDLYYIAMEYVDGGDLKSRLDGPLPPHVCLELIHKIGGALELAHSQGIIHRDVKPANILFRRDGTPLLSDFGIAKQEAVDTELTSTGTILGSPFYMSPEQSEGRVVDGRTDIYNLGVIFYETLTGQRPYDGDSAIKIIMQHLQAPLPSLPEEHERFQSMVADMMAKNRDERIADAATVVGRIKRLQDMERSTVDLAAISKATQTAIPRDQPAPTARNSMRSLWLLLGGVGLFVLGFATFWLFTQTLGHSQVVVAGPITQTIGDIRPEPGSAGTSSGITQTPDPSAPPVAEVVRALEWLARSSLRDNRLTSPAADNAYYYYSRLLAIDPNNETARSGFGSIAERYVVLAEQQFSNNNYRQARIYIALGRQVAPSNRGLAALETFINTQERSFWDGFMAMFRAS